MERVDGMLTQQIDRDLAEKVMGWSAGIAESTHWAPSTSRDDCAEVLARLTEEQQGMFVREFHRAVGTFTWDALTAEPAQIAEAVWRAT